ncbi:Tetratricopeptide repeat protein [Pseudodesulfovibrio hydrargyri]|uniref:Tetratricopeptide repeat protein n=1 Tax=Pseudodesulfovibrio hydrargyri TaxID=2125990 RepID=A0A1J5N123_9BACT|nr:tetratricopeptide repeat protein [Pseudodesulfovibrio hydrargyri]OIQ49339.1 Tetratricopeptide repeat protein [Pseudodesulfovibrio hydrargyri]
MNDDFFALHLDNGEESLAGPSGRVFMAGGLVRCVFSAATPVKMGMGANSRTHESLTFRFVEQTGKDDFVSRLLGDRHLPIGEAELISLDDLVAEYSPELAYYEEHVIPAMLERGTPEDAPASTIDGRVFNGLFGLGLVYLEQGEPVRAAALFNDLARSGAHFEGRDQFLFNDLGIVLRKCGLFDLAIAFFLRALEYVKDDENLFYNLARAHYENKDWTRSLDYLIQSHKFNPGLTVTNDLLELMVGLEADERLLARYDKPPVPPAVAARARQILAAGSGRLKLDDTLVGRPVEPGRARSGGIGYVQFKRHGSDD